jgi:hypothetical protein
MSFTKKPLEKPDINNKPLPFGLFHTDHMSEIDYSVDED